MRSAYFHEDDYCQIELLPLDNLEFCLKQAGEISQFSEEHWKGMGWDSVYVRKENPSKLSNLNIQLNDMRLAISETMPEYDEVYTGYRSYREKCVNTYAFGGDKSATLFFETDSSNIVLTAWCSDAMPELLDLKQSRDLLLADWGWGFICPLSDKERFENYLTEREKVFSELAEKWKVERIEREKAKKKWWKFW